MSNTAPVTAAVISAIGSLVSASAATFTVLSRRPKVTVTVRRGATKSRDRFFIEDPKGDTIAVSVVNERDVAIELETVWVQLRPGTRKRLAAWFDVHRIRRLGSSDGITALFPQNTLPELPKTINGRHRTVVRFGLAQVQQAVSAAEDNRGRAIARMSDDRLVVSKWLDLSGSADSTAPTHEVSPKYQEAPDGTE